MSDPLKELVANKTLTIDLSEEYKIKIEEPQELGKSFFADIYKKAAIAVSDIITQTENSISDKKDPFYNEKQDYNNIIAFCGERGTGKSSAMITFAQSLIKNRATKDFYDKTEKLRDRKFETINVIDPSLFEEDENIFEVILAQLFSRFEKELENKENEKDIDKKRKLLEKFEKVYENLQTIKKDGQKYDGEALETLSKLACGANLRNNFKDLVNLLLDFITKKNEDAYLIIPIDDFDLNVAAVADMAEQIRKYLLIPRVIILMAANMEQLVDAIELNISKTFNDKVLNGSTSIKDKTQSYLTKLIPENRRLKLDINFYEIDNQIDIRWNKDDDGNLSFPEIFAPKPVDPDTPNGKQHIEYTNTKTFIQILTFQKTGFYSEHITILVPPRIRDFKEFLILLIRQGNCNKYENIQKFKAYILEKTFYTRLSSQQKNIVTSWERMPFKTKNYGIITSLYNQIKIEFEKRLNERFISVYLIDERISEDKPPFVRTRPSLLRNEIKEILDKKVNEVNISLGDVLLILKYYNRNLSKSENDFFTISIKSIYSLELLSLFFNPDNKSIDNLSSLIAGNFYNPADISPLRASIRNSKRHFFPFSLESLDNCTQDDDFLIEWLIFFISRVGLNTSRIKETTLFKQSIYYKAGSIQVTNVEFNILNFLATIFDVNLQNERLYGENRKKNTSSIFNEINTLDKNQIAIFLNIDVIEQIVNHDFTPSNDKLNGAFHYHFEKFVNEFMKLIKDKYSHLISMESPFINNNPLLKYFQKDYLKEIENKYKEEGLTDVIKLPDDIILPSHIQGDKDKLEFELNKIKNELLEKIESIDDSDFLVSEDKQILKKRFELSIMLNEIFFYDYLGIKDKTKTINVLLDTVFSNIRDKKRTEALKKYLNTELEILNKHDINIDIEDINEILASRKRFDLKKEDIILKIKESYKSNE